METTDSTGSFYKDNITFGNLLGKASFKLYSLLMNYLNETGFAKITVFCLSSAPHPGLVGGSNTPVNWFADQQ